MGILQGRAGIVTGASSGIGRAIAEVAAAEGARLLLADIDEKGGEETLRRVRAAGAEAAFARADVTDESSVRAMVRAAVDRFGALHWAANNAAGGEISKLLCDLTQPEWDSFVDVALKGVWLCMKHEIPAMIESGGGSIVNTGSMVGLNGQPTLGAYAAAKGGVIALSKTAAAEYAPMGIRVNVVNPGMIATPGNQKFLDVAPQIAALAIGAHALNRMGRPEEVANAIVWLASERASFVTGECVAVDGGTQVKATTYPLAQA